MKTKTEKIENNIINYYYTLFEHEALNILKEFDVTDADDVIKKTKKDCGIASGILDNMKDAFIVTIILGRIYAVCTIKGETFDDVYNIKNMIVKDTYKGLNTED